MPLTDIQRIERGRRHPRIVELWQSLQPLKSVVGFMNSGAHPDDEITAMLVALGWRDGLQLSFACANRGEGGQNNIGTESGLDLGTLRTAEMERAADVLNMRLYWLSENPQDSISDFGFSKSGIETLERWGDARTLARFVHIVRRERPDIICPTFLDVPGQHGHHRAMTEMAHRVMSAAADPDYQETPLAPWRASKLYLPAWSGAGQSYDDDLPPPPATLIIEAKGLDPVTGWSWEQIAQQSRAYHATQGMGAWIPAGAERDWPLHLAESHVEGPDEMLTSGLPATLADLSAHCDTLEISEPLTRAQAAIDRAIDNFPEYSAVRRYAVEASQALTQALAIAPDSVRHRLERKRTQLAHVIRLAAGVEIVGRTTQDWITPGEEMDLEIESRKGDADTLLVRPDLPAGCAVTGTRITVSQSATQSESYPDFHDPAVPRAPALVVDVTCDGVVTSSRLALEMPPVILPSHRATLAPKATVLNTKLPARSLTVAVAECHPASAHVEMHPPEGWSATSISAGFKLTVPEDVGDGLFDVGLSVDGKQAIDTTRIAHPHVAPRLRCAPAQMRVRTLAVDVPDVRIGYVGGGHDRIGHWMRAIGLNVEDVTDAELGDADALARYGSLVVGIFAMRFRPALAQSMPLIHAWVRAGGNLVTLYHRPWDNWNAESTALARLEIGQPSLRWRVTDETAQVTYIAPEHSILAGPNRITTQDWQGWTKERGLYFASSWDTAYQPLLQMSDPGEEPLRGALLVGEFDKGQHVHCALILHHQMENLVPGAFRLMANLVARP